MIRLEGRTTDAVDEFMLRLGHLKVVCRVAAETNGVRHQLERAFADVLTKPTNVGEADLPWVGRYLSKKHLCLVRTGSATEKSPLASQRYPNLVLDVDQHGPTSLRDIEDTNRTPVIWWQDWCLSQCEVRSRVGSVTVEAKSGSKTGVSHVVDWAETLGLLSRSGQPSPEARLLGEMSFGNLVSGPEANPYVIGAERLLLLWALAQADTDVFIRLLPRLAPYSGVMQKRDAADCFMRTVEDLVDESESSRYLTARQTFQLSSQLRDLHRAIRRSRGAKTVNSTVWHRTSSRFESYVDLGLLQKGAGSEGDKFEYLYQPTELLRRVVESFEKTETIDEWFDWHMVECLSGEVRRRDHLSRDELRTVLPAIVMAIRSPAAVPINALALGIVVDAVRRGTPIHLGTARESIEHLAREHEEVGRLARGSAGQRPEYVNLNLRRL